MERVKGSKSTFFAIFVCILISRAVITGIEKLTYTADGTLNINMWLAAVSIIAMFILAFLSFILQYGLIYLGLRRGLDLPIQFNMVKDILNVGMIIRIIGVIILSCLILIPSAIIFLLPYFLVMSIDPAILKANVRGIEFFKYDLLWAKHIICCISLQPHVVSNSLGYFKKIESMGSNKNFFSSN